MVQKQKILDVLSAEPGLCHASLVEPDGLCCAVGALLYHAGVPPEKLRKVDSSLMPEREWICSITGVSEDLCDVDCHGDSIYKVREDGEELKLRALLHETYGLGPDLIDRLINLNDDSRMETPEERKTRVIGTIYSEF